MGLANTLREHLTSTSANSVKLRFLFVGGLNTAFGLSIYPVLMWLMKPMHVHYMIPLVMSHPIGIVFSFVTNKFLTFRTKKNYLAEFSKFTTFYFLNFAVNLAALPVLVEVFHFSPVPAQFFFAFIVIVTSYFWHSRITFAPRRLADGQE